MSKAYAPHIDGKYVRTARPYDPGFLWLTFLLKKGT